MISLWTPQPPHSLSLTCMKHVRIAFILRCNLYIHTNRTATFCLMRKILNKAIEIISWTLTFIFVSCSFVLLLWLTFVFYLSLWKSCNVILRSQLLFKKCRSINLSLWIYADNSFWSSFRQHYDILPLGGTVCQRSSESSELLENVLHFPHRLK